MKILLSFLISVVAFAAPVVTITGPGGNVKAGSTVQLTVSISGTAGQSLAGLQEDINIPGVFSSCVAGSASVTANKQVDCNTINGVVRFIVSGINTTVLSDGVIALITVTIPVNTPAGTVTVGGSNMIGANLNADGVVITSGTPFLLGITSPCDLDGSGLTDSADVAILRNFILGKSLAGGIDLNNDGFINFIDLQRLINSVGNSCKIL